MDEVPPQGYQAAMDGFERAILMRAFERCGGSVAAAARLLDLPYTSLRYRIERLEISVPGMRGGRRKPKARARSAARK